MLRAGNVLGGRYRLTDRVGGGGMGDVWRAEDRVLGRVVAVKVLLARYGDAASFRERFRREARAIAGLESPGIVDVYDFDEDVPADGERVSYLVMQFIEGEPLSRRLRGWGRLRTADALRLVAQAADALEAAHAAGIVHRDIKPGNMLVRPDGRLVLVDFGIARDPSAATLTATGAVLGTATYMSPEQASGLRATAASDIYSLGVVAHQALSGEPPFTADTPFVVASMHVRQEPPPLPDDVPEAVRDFVGRALAKDPADRWSSAEVMARAARRLAEEPASRRPAPGPAAAAAGGPGAAGTTVLDRPRPVRMAVPAAERSPRAGAHRPGPVPRRGAQRFTAVMLGGLLALALTVAVVLAGAPWDGSDGGDPGGGRGRHLDGEMPLNEPGAPEAAAPRESGDPSSPAATDSAAPPADPSAPPGSPSPTPEASDSPPSPSPAPSTVPTVVGLTEAAARTRLDEAGFVPAVTYVGEGEPCSVSAQDPGSASTAPPGSTVTITVQRSTEPCAV